MKNAEKPVKRVKNFMVFYDRENDEMVLRILADGKKPRNIGRKNIYIDCPCWSEFPAPPHPRVAMCGFSDGFDIEKHNITIK